MLLKTRIIHEKTGKHELLKAIIKVVKVTH